MNISTRSVRSVECSVALSAVLVSAATGLVPVRTPALPLEPTAIPVSLSAAAESLAESGNSLGDNILAAYDTISSAVHFVTVAPLLPLLAIPVIGLPVLMQVTVVAETLNRIVRGVVHGLADLVDLKFSAIIPDVINDVSEAVGEFIEFERNWITVQPAPSARPSGGKPAAAQTIDATIALRGAIATATADKSARKSARKPASAVPRPTAAHRVNPAASTTSPVAGKDGSARGNAATAAHGAHRAASVRHADPAA